MSLAPSSSSDATSVLVATHGHCLDGLLSATLFTRLLRHVEGGKSLAFAYRPCGYGPGENGVPEEAFVGAVNAVLDYRYSPSAKLDWFFDHHATAFVTDADRASYTERASTGRVFHDGTYGSCTKLIADVGAKHFGLNPEPFADLVHWADLIDAARFPNAAMPVEKREAPLRLMAVVERFGNEEFLARWVPRLLEEPFLLASDSAEVRELYAPLGADQEAFVRLVRAHAKVDGPTVVVDLGDELLEAAPKFVTYALFPDSLYSVVLTRSSSKCKISVGFNPWAPSPRRHDISAICQRFGGGGHPVVGAASTKADELDRARGIVASIVAELGA
jgi:hypothetical protein